MKTYEDISIEEYINAKWRGDISVISPEEFVEIETQYIDTAGLYESAEFEKVSYIHYLNNRKNSIALSIRLQREFIENFNIPYVPELGFFKKFGHTVKWNNDITDFIEQLRRIESKEKKYISQLEIAIKELTDMREKKEKGVQQKKQTRGEFVSTLISLGKCGYRIKRKETSLEELAYMIKQQKEEQDKLNKHKNR